MTEPRRRTVARAAIVCPSCGKPHRTPVDARFPNPDAVVIIVCACTFTTVIPANRIPEAP